MSQKTDAEKLKELEEKHTELTAAHKEKEGVIKTQAKELDDANSVNAELQNRVEELELKLANKGEIAKPEKEVKPVIPSKSFKVEGETYVFNAARFTNPLKGHQLITAEEALTDKELLAHLVEIEAGVISRKSDK